MRFAWFRRTVPRICCSATPKKRRNAGLLAAAVLALHDPALAQALQAWRERQTQAVLAQPDPRS